LRCIFGEIKLVKKKRSCELLFLIIKKLRSVEVNNYFQGFLFRGIAEDFICIDHITEIEVVRNQFLGLQLLAFNIFQEHAGSAGADQAHGNSVVSDPEFLNMQFYRFAVYTYVGEVTAGFQQSTSDFCPGPLNTKAFISKVFLD